MNNLLAALLYFCKRDFTISPTRISTQLQTPLINKQINHATKVTLPMQPN
jgi:hypothetical protein